MINNNVFYHGITRKVIVAFGNLFSDIKIARKEDDSVTGTTTQLINVPIAYAPKEKWIVRLEQDPTLNQHVYTILPRMSFEITGMNYDTSRKLNKMNQLTCYDPENGMKRSYFPVPYNIDISLYVLTKTQEDGLQIIEQILPYFSPEFNLRVKALPELNTFLDVPVILNGLTLQDDYEGDFQTRRFVTWTLNFTVKTSLFGPVANSSYIETVNTSIEGDAPADYTANGESTTGNITEVWIEGF